MRERDGERLLNAANITNVNDNPMLNAGTYNPYLSDAAEKRKQACATNDDRASNVLRCDASAAQQIAVPDDESRCVAWLTDRSFASTCSKTLLTLLPMRDSNARSSRL